MDKDGYPEQSELDTIKNWPYGSGDHVKLMESIMERWKYADCGYWSESALSTEDLSYLPNEGRLYTISTGGWSGNEDIIQAMEGNLMFWAFCWWSSRRGGHYEFVVK